MKRFSRPQHFFQGIVALLACFSFFAPLLADEKEAIKVEHSSLDYQISKGKSVLEIAKPLTGKKGRVRQGRALFLSPVKGNCLACHRVRQMEELAKKQPDLYGSMGDIGPELDGVSKTYQAGELRLILVDAQKVFPDTIMPAYYKRENIHRPIKDRAGETLMSAQEIEDLLAFMRTLK